MTEFIVSKLWKMAQDLSNLPTENEKIRKINITQEYYEHLDQTAKNRKLLTIQINGRTRDGKTTVGIAEGQRFHQTLKKYKLAKNPVFNMANIARDQQEYSKIMRDPNTEYTIIVTDEDNALETGGENATIEAQLQTVFSKVQAGRYVHRISCAPKEIIDSEAELILEVVATNTQERTTLCYLYYRVFRPGNEAYNQLLGYVIINVAELIKNWEDKVKKHFMKPNRTKEDEEVIKEWAQKDFYVEYMIKKYEKMNLITKEGIFRPRMMDRAEAILNVTQALKEVAQITRNTELKDIIKNHIKMEMRKAKIPMTILGEEQATREALGLLSMYRTLAVLKEESAKLRHAMMEPSKPLSNEKLEAIKHAIQEKDKASQMYNKRADEEEKPQKDWLGREKKAKKEEED